MTGGHAERHAGVEDVDLSGTTVLVTGATGGIGRETALALGRLGSTVLVHGRDRERGEEVLDRLHESNADGAELYLASFEEMRTVAEFAETVAAEHDRLDVLVNNAGGYFSDGTLTPEGVERTFAVNHLAPFVLTQKLLPQLRDGSGRVVTVSSEAHRGGDIPTGGDRKSAAGSTADSALDLDALQTTAGYSSWDAYCRSKLANVLFTFELARRVSTDAVTANCCHPGVVLGSGFTRNMIFPARVLTWMLSRAPSWVPRPFLDRPAEAAATQTHLAAATDLADVTGEYFKDLVPAEPSDRAADADLARALWTGSRELVEVDLPELPAE